MGICNFVDFENLIYMKLYNLLILNKVFTSIDAALNWSGNGLIRGVPRSTDCLLNAGPTASKCRPMLQAHSNVL